MYNTRTYLAEQGRYSECDGHTRNCPSEAPAPGDSLAALAQRYLAEIAELKAQRDALLTMLGDASYALAHGGDDMRDAVHRRSESAIARARGEVQP